MILTNQSSKKPILKKIMVIIGIQFSNNNDFF